MYFIVFIFKLYKGQAKIYYNASLINFYIKKDIHKNKNKKEKEREVKKLITLYMDIYMDHHKKQLTVRLPEICFKAVLFLRSACFSTSHSVLFRIGAATSPDIYALVL